MSSKDRKRKQKQKALESQKKIRLELKESQAALEKEKKLNCLYKSECCMYNCQVGSWNYT